MIPRHCLRLWLIYCGTASLTARALLQTRGRTHLPCQSKIGSLFGVSNEQTVSGRTLHTPAPHTQETIVVPRHYKDESSPDDETIFEYPSLLHNIHIRSILTATEASTCLEISTDYASTTGCWTRPDSERHASYATCDFPVDECDKLMQYLDEIEFPDRMLGLMSELYKVPVEGLSFLDLFCAHYQAKDDEESLGMDRLEPHRDGSLLSFVILLNPPDEFEGGGTYFDALRDANIHDTPRLHKGVIRIDRPGDATIHSGKLLHGANVVTSGKRTVLVGFVDVVDTLQRRGVLFEACRDFGRMHVATKRFGRQQQMTSDGQNGWFMNHERWLVNKNDSSGRRGLRGFCPAFSSVERRADPEFQRRKRLEAEDLLLRSILLGESERDEAYDLFAGDVTIL
jgi:hypothetical protein